MVQLSLCLLQTVSPPRLCRCLQEAHTWDKGRQQSHCPLPTGMSQEGRATSTVGPSNTGGHLWPDTLRPACLPLHAPETTKDSLSTQATPAGECQRWWGLSGSPETNPSFAWKVCSQIQGVWGEGYKQRVQRGMPSAQAQRHSLPCDSFYVINPTQLKKVGTGKGLPHHHPETPQQAHKTTFKMSAGFFPFSFP